MDLFQHLPLEEHLDNPDNLELLEPLANLDSGVLVPTVNLSSLISDKTLLSAAFLPKPPQLEDGTNSADLLVEANLCGFLEPMANLDSGPLADQMELET